MNDEIIWVDFDDREIGYGKKLETHKKNKLHRAFSVFLVNGDQMLIQQRAYNKYHSGGLWANSCCSHPRRGEDIQDAVNRRVKEELGIKCSAKEVFSFVYFAEYEGLSEFEYDHVFLGEYHGSVDFDKQEIEQVKWIQIDELENLMLEKPEIFAKWFLIACPKVMKILRGRDKI